MRLTRVFRFGFHRPQALHDAAVNDRLVAVAGFAQGDELLLEQMQLTDAHVDVRDVFVEHPVDAAATVRWLVDESEQRADFLWVMSSARQLRMKRNRATCASP